MDPNTKLIILVLFCAFLHLSHGQNECKKCMLNNEAYCVNKTSYYLCMNGAPLTSSLYKCPNNQVCTNSLRICEPESGTTEAVCKQSSCGRCPTDGSKYTCVSKTQFGRCIDNEVAIVSSCERGSICSIEMLSKAGNICTPTCVLDFFNLSPTCSNELPVTTTVAPPTTPNVAVLKAKCKADAQYNQNNKIFYVLNDNECKTYIYCEKTNNDVEALLMRCSNGYYDVELKECVTTQPEGCGVPSNTTKNPPTNPTTNRSTTRGL